MKKSNNEEKDFILFMGIVKNESNQAKAYSTLFKNHKSFIYDIIHRRHPSLISNIETSSREIFDLSIVKVQKKIFSNEYQYDGRASFRTYIFEVYKYTAKEISKEQRKKKFDLLADYGQEQDGFLTKVESTPYLDAFKYAIQKVENEVHQEVLRRILLEGDAVKSVAANFGIKPITVRQIKNRKLPFIKQEMMKYDASLQIG